MYDSNYTKFYVYYVTIIFKHNNIKGVRDLSNKEGNPKDTQNNKKNILVGMAAIVILICLIFLIKQLGKPLITG